MVSGDAAEVRAHTEAGLGLELVSQLDVRRNSFPRRTVKQWTRQSKEVVQSPSYPRPGEIKP